VQQLITDVTGVPFALAARNLRSGANRHDAQCFRPAAAGRPAPGRRRPDWHLYPEAAAAGLWTTPHDLARCACAVQAALAGRESAVRAQTAAAMLTRHAALPAKGDWNLLPVLGLRPPDAFGLGMFLHGSDRFSHIGGAASFFSVLTASAQDGTGAVVMTAANASPFPFRLLRAISRERGWTRVPPARLEAPARAAGDPAPGLTGCRPANSAGTPTTQAWPGVRPDLPHSELPPISVPAGARPSMRSVPPDNQSASDCRGRVTD
jgi:hypothetical protein